MKLALCLKILLTAIVVGKNNPFFFQKTRPRFPKKSKSDSGDLADNGGQGEFRSLSK
jgi:hypothetical protein